MNPHIVQRIMRHENYDTTLSFAHVNDKLLLTEAKKYISLLKDNF